MIKINVNKKKIIEFDVNVTGVQCEALSGRLSLFYEDIIYSFPATIEDGNVIKIEMPVLNDIISDIPDKHKVDMRLEVVGKDTFMLPWAGQAYLEHPVAAEATMRGAKLVEDDEPKISVGEIREEDPVEEEKYDTKSLSTSTGTARKKKAPKVKKDSKLAKALDKEGEEKKKEDEEEEKKKEPKKLGEELAKALLGEQFKPKSVKEIQKKADQLKKKLQRSKMKENFGQKEIRQLEDFTGMVFEYPNQDRQKVSAIIDGFRNWAETYTGK